MASKTMDCETLEEHYLHQVWDTFSYEQPYKEPTKSLCFIDAYWAKDKKKISENEYIAYLVAHYSGIRHPPTSSRYMDICQTPLYEPFAASIRKHALETRYRPVKDTSIYEKLFQSCLEKNIEEVKTRLGEIERTHPDAVPYVPLAALAARDGVSPILQLCLEKGATFDRFLARACASCGLNYPEIDRLIAPHESTIAKLLEGKRAPDGNFTGDQLEEWFGGIDW